MINEEQHGGYSLRDVFHVLFKRKWLIIGFAMSTSMVGGVITLGGVIMAQVFRQRLRWRRLPG